jgi:hypothetical protein
MSFSGDSPLDWQLVNIFAGPARTFTMNPSFLSAVSGLCLALGVAAVHAAPLTVQSLPYKGKLPYVQAADARLAQRINQAIFLDIIDMAAPLRLSDGIRERKKPEGLEPISDIGFQVVRNDESLLVLAVSYEGCGAYCEHRDSSFNFDAATGRSLQLSDLVTAAGREQLNQRLEALRVARVNAEIAKLRAGLKAADKKVTAKAGKGSIEPADAEAAIEMYQDCVKSIQDPEMAKYRTIDGDAFRIGNDAITFYWGRCSNHAMQALDEIGEFANTLSVKELAPYFTDYGKALLLGSGKAAPPGSPFDQVLTGKVGSVPITLKLGKRSPDGSIGGSYFYEKYRSPIAFFGKLSGDTLEVDETTDDGKSAPKIRVTIRGERLVGRWTGGGKDLAFEVGP